MAGPPNVFMISSLLAIAEQTDMPVKKTTRGRKTTEVEEAEAGVEVEGQEAEPATAEQVGRSGAGGWGLSEVIARVHEREEARTPARKAAQERREAEVLAAAEAVTVESAIRGIAELKLSINQTLDGLAASVVSEAKKLVQVREAAEVLARRIQEMHDIEVVADALEALVRKYETQAVELEREAERRAREFEEAAAARRRAFDAEMAEARAAWEKEKQTWREAFDAECAAARREWQREQEEHEYTTRTKRAREQQEFEALRASQAAALAEERAKQEKALAEREAAVAAREQELADLRARVESFPAELQKAVQRAREEAAAVESEKARHEAELRAREVDGETRLLKQRIQTLEQVQKDLSARVLELQKELKEATDRVRDIAVKAIEGASGAAALARVNEIAIQQAKARAEP